MLELIFQGFTEWIYGLILECFQYFSFSMLDIMSLDFAYLKTHAPVIDSIIQVITAAGWALLLGNLVFQALKSMTAGLGVDGEDPKLLFLRTFLFSFLLLASPQICELGLNLTSNIMTILEIPDAIDVTLVDKGLFGNLTAAWLLVIVCGLIIMFKVLCLILEIAERYVILALLTITAPLAFAMGGSRSTSDIFVGWCRMFGSMCVLMAVNIIFFKLLLSVLSTIPSGLDVFPWMVLILAIAKVARKTDSIITRIGLNPAITGESFLSRLPGALSYMVIRMVASKIASTVGNSVGGTGGIPFSGSAFGRSGPLGSGGGGAGTFFPGLSGRSGSRSAGEARSSETAGGSAGGSRSSSGFESGSRDSAFVGSQTGGIGSSSFGGNSGTGFGSSSRGGSGFHGGGSFGSNSRGGSGFHGGDSFGSNSRGGSGFSGGGGFGGGGFRGGGRGGGFVGNSPGSSASGGFGGNSRNSDSDSRGGSSTGTTAGSSVRQSASPSVSQSSIHPTGSQSAFYNGQNKGTSAAARTNSAGSTTQADRRSAVPTGVRRAPGHIPAGNASDGKLDAGTAGSRSTAQQEMRPSAQSGSGRRTMSQSGTAGTASAADGTRFTHREPTAKQSGIQPAQQERPPAGAGQRSRAATPPPRAGMAGTAAKTEHAAQTRLTGQKPASAAKPAPSTSGAIHEQRPASTTPARQESRRSNNRLSHESGSGGIGNGR